MQLPRLICPGNSKKHLYCILVYIKYGLKLFDYIIRIAIYNVYQGHRKLNFTKIVYVSFGIFAKFFKTTHTRLSLSTKSLILS